jgi:ribosomal protein L7/L12
VNENKLKKYSQMKTDGSTPFVVYVEADKDGVGAVEGIKLIRDLFGLSFVEAKEVMLIATGAATSLDQHMRRVAEGLKHAFNEADDF